MHPLPLSHWQWWKLVTLHTSRVIFKLQYSTAYLCRSYLVLPAVAWIWGLLIPQQGLENRDGIG